ncbi:helix-turn-helix domain-containing protein [Candidatus Erwinia dacicola]|uniref:Helix-turn-helix domain protein n=1 Tax=Candidatus Erwinia dacicola TaxID=252393 RepID=A0A1E7YYP6_9GAMM|nr:helix-turn-helix domain-containing protein [Candidatus Erwinia dacicola]NJD00363.1 helix-turn-helix domain-containing protein [Candidatus Erwinia dacicola]NJD86149.1 helix-turn-helix domain-containing protein [Candidatus Erwinia dacicola]OFC61623.1 hypothetical protein BBW68_12240 [Candidatus Erwinia dacicola]RAP70020.1 helix-turn-helix domain protein [Candidatus Erwinia dacicola]
MNSISYRGKTADKAKDREQFFVRYGINRFSDRLKEAMKTAGIPSNNQLAKDTELSEATIRKYLKGATFPTLDRLALLAGACGCSLAWLASGDSGTESNAKNKDEKLKYNNDTRVSEVENILSYLTHEQRVKFLRVIYTKGIAAILSLDDAFDAQFLALPDSEKERLLALHEAKKGGSEGSEVNSKDSLAQEAKRAG